MTTANGVLDAAAIADITMPNGGSLSTHQRIALFGGGSYQLPKGWITLYEIGPFLDLQRYDPARQMWVTPKTPMRGLVPPFWCDGVSWRMVNTVGCTIACAVTAAGSGYDPATPPAITPTNTPISGRKKPTIRTIVGGAITVTVVSGGVYDYPPTIRFDYSAQTPPFRPAQIDFQINGTSGAITDVYHDGNDTAGAKGGLGSAGAYSGAGLNAATLTYTLVRDPRDTQTSDAVLSVAAAASGKVTAADVTDFGTPIGNNDATNALTITHNGGSGATFRLINNYYVTGVTITNGGAFVNGSAAAYNSSVDGFYPPIVLSSSMDDEQGRPMFAIGNAVITSGAITAVNNQGMGPGLQQRPRGCTIVPGPGLTINTWPTLTPVLGTGGDYFSFECWSSP